jgi:hypothetical protein
MSLRRVSGYYGSLQPEYRAQAAGIRQHKSGLAYPRFPPQAQGRFFKGRKVLWSCRAGVGSWEGAGERKGGCGMRKVPACHAYVIFTQD